MSVQFKNQKVLRANYLLSGNNVIDLTQDHRIQFSNMNGQSVYIDPLTRTSNLELETSSLEGKTINRLTINNLTSTQISANEGHFINIDQTINKIKDNIIEVDNELKRLIEKEIATRINEDERVSLLIDDEAETRIKEDKKLHQLIEDEILARSNADQRVSELVSNETQIRITEDKRIEAMIKNLDIEKEKEERIAEDAKIWKRIEGLKDELYDVKVWISLQARLITKMRKFMLNGVSTIVEQREFFNQESNQYEFMFTLSGRFKVSGDTTSDILPFMPNVKFYEIFNIQVSMDCDTAKGSGGDLIYGYVWTDQEAQQIRAVVKKDYASTTNSRDIFFSYRGFSQQRFYMDNE